MNPYGELVFRWLIAIVAIAFIRDGIAGLRGRELWILKNSAWIIFKGRSARVWGALFVLTGSVCLLMAWRGL